MSQNVARGTPLLLWPVVALWRLVTFVVALTGRLIAVVLGLVLIVIGGILTVTVVGAVVGLPLMALGLLLVARGFF